jgi:hypothetical protein
LVKYVIFTQGPFEENKNATHGQGMAEKELPILFKDQLSTSVLSGFWHGLTTIKK